MTLTPAGKLPLHLDVKVWSVFEALQESRYMAGALNVALQVAYFQHGSKNVPVAGGHGLLDD